jgi:hypothetical protein
MVAPARAVAAAPGARSDGRSQGGNIKKRTTPRLSHIGPWRATTTIARTQRTTGLTDEVV